jgi:(p)ppGpp synthase/HD superfamily hydrolase
VIDLFEDRRPVRPEAAGSVTQPAPMISRLRTIAGINIGSTAMMELTHRFTEAFDLARVAHGKQRRKGSGIPYLYHLMGVSSLVLEFGGNEDQAIAALLHDVIEDCGQSYRQVVREKFGDAVADIVDACTDGTAEGKGGHASSEDRQRAWWRRKLAYIEHLQQADDATLLVSACDKLHNARAIVADAEDPEIAQEVFNRFTAGKDGTLRYYHSLAAVFAVRGVKPARQLDSAVARMHVLAGNLKRAPLQ